MNLGIRHNVFMALGVFIGICGVVMWLFEMALGRTWSLGLVLGQDSGFQIVPLHVAVFFVGLVLYVVGRVISITR